MFQKAVMIRFLVLFLGFSFAISSAAVPTTRSLKSTIEHPTVKDSVAQDVLDLRNNGEEISEEGFIIEGRMDWERGDYPGTGANHHHDPITPGRP